ncbi:inositol monophosphatase [Patescibacteria group bacterium]|nr:inositol monophosphatase [Patescibacteria group bacterium]
MSKTYLQVAIGAARKAGKLLKKNFFMSRTVLEKNNSGLHLKADIEAEKIIKNEIKKYFPKHDILAEESGQMGKKSDYLWIIDPLDGTSNYYFYNPFFCISIALAYKNEIITGVVYAPITGEIFWAKKDGGLYVDNNKYIPSKKPQITRSVFGGYKNENRCYHILNYGPRSKTHHNKMEMASAALALSYVACGRLNTYLLDHCRIWDIAAGVLLVRESGGKVSNWKGEDWIYGQKNILASNDEKLREEILMKIEN